MKSFGITSCACAALLAVAPHAISGVLTNSDYPGIQRDPALGHGSPQRLGDRLRSRERIAPVEQERMWQVLEKFPEQLRGRFAVELSLAPDAPIELALTAGAVENAWLVGSYDDAIQRLRAIEESAAQLEMLTIYRTLPTGVSSQVENAWGDDHEFVMFFEGYPMLPTHAVKMEADPSTGVTYAMVGGPQHLAGFYSYDHGETWNLTSYQLPGLGVTWGQFDCELYEGYFYSGFESVEVGRVNFYRHSSTNGLWDRSWGKSLFFPQSVVEFALAHKEEDLSRLYAAVILDDGSLAVSFWDGSGSFTHTYPPISNAARALDVTFNPGFGVDDVAVLVSVVDSDANLVLLKYQLSTGWQAPEIFDTNAGLGTAVAANGNRFLVAYEHFDVDDSTYSIRYYTNYNGGNGIWYFGDASPLTGTDYYYPSLTGRYGDGFQLAFIDVASNRVVTRHRAYGSGPGTTMFEDVEVISDSDVNLSYIPSIEWIPPAGTATAYGALWIGLDPDRHPFFDSTEASTTALADSGPVGATMGVSTLKVFPTPYRSGGLHVVLGSEARGALSDSGLLSVFDANGRLVWRTRVSAASPIIRWNGRGLDGRALAAGTYFLKLEGAVSSRSVAQKFTVVR